MSGKLANQVAVVTGSSKGIGAEIARELARQGAAVVVHYSSDSAGADKVVREIQASAGAAVAVKADLSIPDQSETLIAAAVKAFGRVDILVNNAGAYEFSPLSELSLDHYHKLFNLNVLGLLLTTKAAVKAMGPQGGSIINISSMITQVAFANASVYSATKGAVDAITRSLSAELGPQKIRINGIGPGMVETEGTQTQGISGSDMQREVAAKTPLGRTGQPKDIAPLAAFLASPDSSWMTGETIYISGGYR